MKLKVSSQQRRQIQMHSRSEASDGPTSPSSSILDITGQAEQEVFLFSTSLLMRNILVHLPPNVALFSPLPSCTCPSLAQSFAGRNITHELFTSNMTQQEASIKLPRDSRSVIDLTRLSPSSILSNRGQSWTISCFQNSEFFVSPHLQYLELLRLLKNTA